MKKILVAFGTRPEIIKLAPVVQQLEIKGFQVCTMHTGQHLELANDMMQLFSIQPDHDLAVMTDNQSLSQLTEVLIPKITEVLLTEQPDAVIVHGDTTSAYLSALSAFYLNIPVYHVEAGLRSFDLHNPFPEEMNRRQISVLANGHFAPTEYARQNLLKEGIADNTIFVTGNTVIDALNQITLSDSFVSAKGYTLKPDQQLILITAHRRENHGKPLDDILDSILRLLERRPDSIAVYPAHPSPSVQEIVSMDKYKHPRLHIVEPYGYFDFLKLMTQADLILTDSGGIQEEAAALGKKLLVLRTTTERQELIDSGYTQLVGSEVSLIVKESVRLLANSTTLEKQLVYGNGTASKQIAGILVNQL